MAVKPLFLKILLIALVCLPSHVWAAAAFPVEEGPGCDPDFYTAMSARADMEGQREIEIAQRLILKPDSVLEYSCFDNHVRNGAFSLATVDNSLFSDNINSNVLFPGHPPVAFRLPPAAPLPLGLVGPQPPGAPPMLPGFMDDELRLISSQPARAFLTDNFSHTLGGGTHAGAVPVCGAMGAIWNFLRCQDFDDGKFIALKDLPNNDPRDEPRVCPGAGARTAMWNAMIATAFPVPATPAAAGGMDEVITYYDRIFSGACAAAPPVLTGVEVKQGAVTIDDAVCSVPGCYYNAGSCN